MDNKATAGNDFKPFIPADRIMPEITPFSVLLGVIVAGVFGAANAYLGLRVGMTISASIPASVISMGIVRGILHRDSILENNMVQTIGSAGDSVAAGCVFTLPAIFLWYSQWGMGTPSLIEISAIAVFGGILGVLFMIPLRRALIVKEHGVLPYPEGTACADVLLAGEQGGDRAKTTFVGLGVAAVFKFLADGIKLFPSEIEYAFKGFKGAAVGMDTLPALLGVGYIIGLRVSALMLSGAVLGWLVLMPAIAYIGGGATTTIFPSTVPISQMDHWAIWGSYLRYIGAGSVAFGGFVSLITSIPLLFTSFRDAIKGYEGGAQGASIPRTDRDLPLKIVLIGLLVIVLAIGMTPIIPVGFMGGLIIAVFGFFFATVSSRIVGLIGCANNPVSGMTIATLIITAFIFKATGNDGHAGMVATVTIGAVICVVASNAGDMSQDLKTGFLVGATPEKQQIGEIIGVLSCSVFIGVVLLLLNDAWGFGSRDLPAPQATLMKLVVEGVMSGDLPWSLVFVGFGVGATLFLLDIPILPVAIGLYLPIHLSVPVMVGGLARGYLDYLGNKAEEGSALRAQIDDKTNSGVLFSSGLIAGEGLIGVLLAVLAALHVDITVRNLFGAAAPLVSLAFFLGLTLWLLKASLWKKV